MITDRSIDTIGLLVWTGRAGQQLGRSTLRLSAHEHSINYVVQDAAAAANILTVPLCTGRLSTRHLAAVQRRREWPTRVAQVIVGRIQQVFDLAARSDRPPSQLRLMRYSLLLRDLVARYLAFGIGSVHVSRDLRCAVPPEEPLVPGLSRAALSDPGGDQHERTA